MRELERQPNISSAHAPASPAKVAIVGRGRLGYALSTSLRESGIDASAPLARGAPPAGVDAVLLCVPDAEIGAAAALVAPGALVGHCSGATLLDVLAPHERFSLHPLMTVTAQDDAQRFTGAGAAIAGSTPRALDFAGMLARALGMHPFEVAEGDRAAYHAAASIASNFLITLEAAAERLAAGAGAGRDALAPLVRATVENWVRLGPQRALTGPVARGDEQTVAAQREAISDRAPELLPMFDALVQATRELAAGHPAASRGRGANRMKTLTTVLELRDALAAPRREGRSIGLVPTMGAFHDGHLSLIRRAREECEIVVVSLFVNPAQFNDAGDLEGYPRDEQRDARLAAEAGVDYLFTPAVDEVYPRGFATTVSVDSLTQGLEGASRGRSHFDGVTTVVTKLLNMAAPDVAYFGQKDAQQAAVIKRLVRDLDMPVRIEVCPTIRAADGLALSSRNALLSGQERDRATSLSRALGRARKAVIDGERDPRAVAAAAIAELRSAGVELEYLELVNAHTLAPVSRIEGDVLALVAARVGSTRLIDNTLIHPLPNIDREVATPLGASTIA
jgi:pantoate--beta-alanine ligase